MTSANILYIWWYVVWTCFDRTILMFIVDQGSQGGRGGPPPGMPQGMGPQSLMGRGVPPPGLSLIHI